MSGLTCQQIVFVTKLALSVNRSRTVQSLRSRISTPRTRGWYFNPTRLGALKLVGGARAKEADLNGNGNPAGKRRATRRDPYGIVAF